MRTGVAHAIEHAASFVTPAHLMLGLLAEPRVGAALRGLVPDEHVRGAVKHQEILGFLGSDPERITAAIAQLSSSP